MIYLNNFPQLSNLLFLAANTNFSGALKISVKSNTIQPVESYTVTEYVPVDNFDTSNYMNRTTEDESCQTYVYSVLFHHGQTLR